MYNGEHNVDIQNLRVSLDEQYNFKFSEVSYFGKPRAVAKKDAIKAIQKLGQVGAYTHDLGRYWSLKVLIEEQRLMDILACRYPQILIDEAQDIGSMHGALLSAIGGSGTTVSLIGDPNQAIYEFADADGRFLRSFGGDTTIRRAITENWRSVSQIVNVANAISGSKNKPVRSAPARKHGAFYLTYEKNKLDQLVSAFVSILEANGYQKNESAVLCRDNPLVELVTGGAEEIGQGATEKFASAAITRDRRSDIATSFEHTVDGFLKLLEEPTSTLRQNLLDVGSDGEAKALRRICWRFLRDAEVGLPSSKLKGKSEWQPLLKKRIAAVLKEAETVGGAKASSTIGNRLTITKLTERPLWQDDLASENSSGIRVQTVHKVKGESIEAVLYIAKQTDLKNLLSGTETEEGRIGYVAITRARDLLILGVPSGAKKDQIEKLEAMGFQKWN